METCEHTYSFKINKNKYILKLKIKATQMLQEKWPKNIYRRDKDGNYLKLKKKMILNNW